ncbi:hypothetical protein ACFL54_09745, partial [Planctomycetota bacterium]
MSKICKLLVVCLAVCLFITTVGISKEDTSREKMPRWEVAYWGNENTGLSFEETRGRYGLVFVGGVGKVGIDRKSGSAVQGLLKDWKAKQQLAQKQFLDHGLYFQYLTFEDKKINHSSNNDLIKLTLYLGITLPVASVKNADEFWTNCKLVEQNAYYTGAFLIDPYGRIASRTLAYQSQLVSELEMVSYKQMQREVAEYWLETKAEDIAKADKHFKKKKKRCEAYKTYKPLADKVKAVEAGKVIADRVEQIENEVRNSILKGLVDVTPNNIGKSMAPMKKTMREFKGTKLADEATRQLGALKRAKKDAELLDLIRLNVANTFTRWDRKEEAKAIYQSLAERNKGDENYQGVLSLRIAGEFQLTNKQTLNPSCSVEEWLKKAEDFYAKAEKLLEGENIKREDTTALLLAAAEHYTAAIANSEKEPPGT